MLQVSQFIPSERQRAKQASRAQDDADLREGRVSRAQLRAENGAFSSLDLSSSSVRRRSAVGR